MSLLVHFPVVSPAAQSRLGLPDSCFLQQGAPGPCLWPPKRWGLPRQSSGSEGPLTALFTVVRTPWACPWPPGSDREGGVVSGVDESRRNQNQAHMKRRQGEEAQANRWVAGMTGLVSHSGRWRQRWRHPQREWRCLPGCLWAERLCLKLKKDALGLLSSPPQQCPLAEGAIHINISESRRLRNLEWCMLRGYAINSCLD